MNDTQYTEAKVIEKKANRFTAVASTYKTDRHGENVSQDGWDIANFKKQPRILWAHDHSIPAIGRSAKTWIEGKGKSAKLMFEGEFQEITELGRAAKRLFEDGFIDTFSVGFLPKEMEGDTYLKQELLEISLVNVPANADAQAKAYATLKNEGFSKKTITDLGIPALVLDKLEALGKDVNEIRQELSAVKEQSPSAPQVRSVNTRNKLSRLKLIARTSDKLLSNEKEVLTNKQRIDSVKIIKSATQILIAKEKENL